MVSIRALECLALEIQRQSLQPNHLVWWRNISINEILLETPHCLGNSHDSHKEFQRYNNFLMFIFPYVLLLIILCRLDQQQERSYSLWRSLPTPANSVGNRGRTLRRNTGRPWWSVRRSQVWRQPLAGLSATDMSGSRRLRARAGSGCNCWGIVCSSRTIMQEWECSFWGS